MRLKVGSFDEMAQDIKINKREIVLFGAGVIGSTVIPSLLERYNLTKNVRCFIDNDRSKWNQTIMIADKDISIFSVNHLEKLGDNIVILVNISRYSEAVIQLDSLKCTEKMICYIIPMMCIENFKRKDNLCENESGILKSNLMIIPKVIHYIWFGHNPIPDNLQRCIDSWKKYCPDYEIVQWNEDNYDISKCKYMKQAYEDGKYSFATDYAKLDILYQNGGIYLDADVELLRNIDELLYQEAFCSVEKWQVINFGGCSGSVKGHSAIKAFLDGWEKREYYREDGTPDPISSGIVDTQVALDIGYEINGKAQNVKGMNIYPYDYFHPYDYMSGKVHITKNTYSIHHFNGGWLDEKTKRDNEKTTEVYDRLYMKAKESL